MRSSDPDPAAQQRPADAALSASERRPLRVVDSITELGPHDAGCFAVSGSHGGLSSARYAQAAKPWLSVFNDAGVGKEEAGIAALGVLQQSGLAALAVSHASARIGQANSTLQDGVVSHVNQAAQALGFVSGSPLKVQLTRWIDAPLPG